MDYPCAFDLIHNDGAISHVARAAVTCKPGADCRKCPWTEDVQKKRLERGVWRYARIGDRYTRYLDITKVK